MSQSETREKEIDDLQSSQYLFPYHYLPNVKGFPNFTKIWSFSASYIAAIRLFENWFDEENKEKNGKHQHMDFGCGDGGFIFHVSALKDYKNVDFFGIDFDKKAIRWANQFSNADSFLCGDVMDLPASSYDSGSLVEVYEHIPPSECSKFLSGISDSLKNGASLFVTVPSTQKPTGRKHYRHFDFETLIKEFEEFFVVEEIFGFERKNFINKILSRLLTSRWWYLESKITNAYLINSYSSKHVSIAGCGRIGLIVRKR